MKKKPSPIHSRALLLRELSLSTFSLSTKQLIASLMKVTKEEDREKIAKTLYPLVQAGCEENVILKVKELIEQSVLPIRKQ